jgi:murein DD-endopeptidase MepM/ murein hydrolase activator NlpD
MRIFRTSHETPHASSKRTRGKALIGLITGALTMTAVAVAVSSTQDPRHASSEAATTETVGARVSVPLPLPGRGGVEATTPSTTPTADLRIGQDVLDIQALQTSAPIDVDDQARVVAMAEATLTEKVDPIDADRSLPPRGTWSSEQVRKGDTLSAIFKRAGHSQTTLHELLQAEGLGREFRRLQPGDEVRFRFDGEQMLELAYASDALSTLYVTLEENGWAARTIATPTEVRTRFVGGMIDQSLYVSALDAGLDDRLIMELVGIFGWDVDFALDIRVGDRFGLIHEELYAEDGTKLADGAILAASFTNQGKTFHAVRFADATGTPNYFAPDGYSMRKAFLRSPVDFRRISSRFRGSRYHPVLGVKRPHRGVDYAASRGTPVKASGDGKVIHAARKGGYGKTVILQHGGRYRTLYGHLNGYAKGIKSGKRVRQGQTIGYVGSTGLATGPHLHYEFLVDGVHRNPLTVKLPKADPLDKKLLPDFRTVAEPLLTQLAVHEQTLVAQNAQ